MKLKWTLKIAFLSFAMYLVMGVSSVQAATLVLVAQGDTTLSSANVTVAVGSITTFELWLVNAPASVVTVTSGQWDFTYNADAFGILSSPTGPFNINSLMDVAIAGVDSGPGVVSGSGFLAFPGNLAAATSYQLATIDIYAQAVGTSLLTLLNPNFEMVNSVNSLPLVNFPVNLAINTAQISVVTATPIPAAVWMLGSGLVGLLGFVRLRRNTCV